MFMADSDYLYHQVPHARSLPIYLKKRLFGENITSTRTDFIFQVLDTWYTKNEGKDFVKQFWLASRLLLAAKERDKNA